MSAVTAAYRLADLASAVPGATAVLDRFGLDYWSNGHQRLDSACESGGIYPDSVVQALLALPQGPRPEWAEMRPSRLIEHIETVHHAHLRMELPD
jgi:iron-sulfur cluster repair protein YtfE (RIC family)